MTLAAIVLATAALGAAGWWAYNSLHQKLEDNLTVALDTREIMLTEINASYAEQYAEKQAAAAQAAAGDPNELLAPPLTINGDTIRDVVQYYSRGRLTMDDAVKEFYRRLMEDPEVNGYFRRVDDIPWLQNHFKREVLTFCHWGVYRRDVTRLQKKHAHVRDENDRPITLAAFNKTIGTFVDVLTDNGVKPEAIEGLGKMVAVLRPAIVVEQTT